MDRFAEAVRLHQQGRNSEARRLCSRILQKEPSSIQALALHGTVCAVLGERSEAIRSFRSATRIQPRYAPFSYMLGNLLRETGQGDAAAESYRNAIAVEPRFADAWLNLGLTLHEAGNVDEAIASYKRVLEIDPFYQAAYYNLANALQASAQYGESITCYQRALELDPGNRDTLFNMANALMAAGRLKEAIGTYEEVSRLFPGFAAAYTNRAVALRRCGRFSEALVALDRSLQIDSGSVEALVTKGNVLADSGLLGEAVEVLERAIELAPQNADALFNLGNTHHHARRFAQALEALRRACAIRPGTAGYLGSLFGVQMALWDTDGASASWTDLMKLWGEGVAVPMDTVLERTDDPRLHRQCAAQHAAMLVDKILPPVAARPRVASNTHDSRRYRIGYLSPDFGEHPVGQSIVEVLERHDKERFEVLGLSLRRHPVSAVRERIATAFDSFHDLENLDTYQKIQYCRELGLDMLVDLAGYTADSCAAILASRPAPVVASYLGFASTLGAPWVDYLIADSYVVPQVRSADYQEKLARLPGSFFPSDTRQPFSPVEPDRAREGLPQDAFVYCCFNSARRITPELMDVWMAILRETHNSVLWLQRADELAADNMRKFARDRGVDPARLVFARFVDTRAEHLARHRLADLLLDTFPYNGHSTARDALYAGVPLLTLSGRSMASRVAGSLLTALQMQDLIAEDWAHYRGMAVELAHSRDRLEQLRELMRARRHSSTLFNMASLTGHLERAFISMIERARIGLPPADLAVSDESLEWA